MKKILVVVSAFFLLMTFATASFADLDNHIWPKKLKRGFCNIVTAPVEIPKQTIAGASQKPNVIMAFSGMIKGIAYTLGRMGSGLRDIVTCNLDVPSESLVKPPCVFQDWPGTKKEE